MCSRIASFMAKACGRAIYIFTSESNTDIGLDLTVMSTPYRFSSAIKYPSDGSAESFFSFHVPNIGREDIILELSLYEGIGNHYSAYVPGDR